MSVFNLIFQLPASSVMHAIRLADEYNMLDLKNALFSSISIDVFRGLSADRDYCSMEPKLKAELLEKWGTFLWENWFSVLCFSVLPSFFFSFSVVVLILYTSFRLCLSPPARWKWYTFICVISGSTSHDYFFLYGLLFDWLIDLIQYPIVKLCCCWYYY